MHTGVLLHTKSSKDIKISSVDNLIKCDKLSAINMKFHYVVSDKLQKYRVSPYCLVSETEIKCKPEKILVLGEDVFCISEGRLIKNFTEVVPVEYRVTDLKKIKSMIGVQYPTKLELYSRDLCKITTYECSVSFSMGEILITGYKNQLKIINESTLEIYLNEEIVCVTCDVLFTKIFCGSPSGKIYQINMDGTPNKILDYHNSELRSVKMSTCDKYLYSMDTDGYFLVWDEIVIDRQKIDNLEGFDIFIN